MTKTIKLSTLLSTGKLWEKGAHSRIYLDRFEVAKALGFAWESYKSGNIKSASFGNEEISNSKMSRVLASLDGIYYDNHAKKFNPSDSFQSVLDSFGIEIVDDVKTKPEEAAEEKTHGGAREGAGRKATGNITRTVRLSPEQNELFKMLGSSDFLRTMLDGIKAGKIPVTVDTTKLTDEQKGHFVEGWEEAGGTMDDAESDTPWCAPWLWKPEIIVHGVSPEEWGADFFRQCKPEIDAILAEEEKWK